jgi:hypothetical protein
MHASDDTTSAPVGLEESAGVTTIRTLSALTGVGKVTLTGLDASKTVFVVVSPSGLLSFPTGVAETSLMLAVVDDTVTVTQTGVSLIGFGLSMVSVVADVPSTLVTFSLSFGTTPWFFIIWRHGSLGAETVVVPAAAVVVGTDGVVPETVVAGEPGVVPDTVVGADEVPGTVVPDGVVPETVVPDVVPETVVPDGVVPETVVPDGVVPETVVPDGVVPETVVPDGVVPETVVPDGVVPEIVVPDGVVPETVVPDVVPETVVPDGVVPETVVPDGVVPETVVPDGVVGAIVVPIGVVAPIVVVSSMFDMQATADTISTVVGFESDDFTTKTMLSALIGVSNLITIGFVGSVTVMVLETTGCPFLSTDVYWMVLAFPGVNVKLTYSGVPWLGFGLVTVIIELLLPSTRVT